MLPPDPIAPDPIKSQQSDYDTAKFGKESNPEDLGNIEQDVFCIFGLPASTMVIQYTHIV